MKNLKKYKKWPLKREVLQRRLKKICSKIDSILSEEFTGKVLAEENGQKHYGEKFKDLFSKVGYIYDNNPVIEIICTGKLCGSSVGINFYIKDRKGLMMKC